MLVCQINDADKQLKIDEKMQKAVEFLRREDLDRLPIGRINLVDDRVYVRVMEYETVPFEALKFEAHRKYIDIHYVVSGQEAIWCLPTQKFASTDAYNVEKDVIHGEPRRVEELSKVVLVPGDMVVCYPEDAHAPKGMVGNATEPLKKIVVKIAC
ncbi:MAG: YhcH/YjgK/YiaL family protein [Anaerolineaceae bacterium]|nr:YhcH/YjgK/YiaL family protein [Anaerolineaceae bacterium]